MIYKRRCYHCGSITEAKTEKGKVYCEECREECKQAKKKSKIFHKDEAEYRIVYDPLPEDAGGFKQGSYISVIEVQEMCRAEFRSFNFGTILMDCDGKKYIIAERIGSEEQIVIAMEET